MQKVTPLTFPLASVDNRTALLLGVTAGTVNAAEVQAAVLHDNQKRPYRKPVVAEGIRFDSVTDAAKALLRTNIHSTVESERQRIARLCNGDVTPGYYWSE